VGLVTRDRVIKSLFIEKNYRMDLVGSLVVFVMLL
jgi:hypothetical protein